MTVSQSWGAFATAVSQALLAQAPKKTPAPAANLFGTWDVVANDTYFKDAKIGGESGVDVSIRYTPNPAQIAANTRVAFVQIVRRLDGKNPIPIGTAADVARMTPGDLWRVDRAVGTAIINNNKVAYGDYGWYGLDNNGNALKRQTGSPYGSVVIFPNPAGRASIQDGPRIFANSGTRMEFETFAITYSATNGVPDFGGIVLSGHKWNWGLGMASTLFNKGSDLTAMTPEFLDAVALWDEQANGKLMPKNTPAQRALQGPKAVFVNPT